MLKHSSNVILALKSRIGSEVDGRMLVMTNRFIGIVLISSR